MKRAIRQVFNAHFEYPVVFTRDLFDPANPALISAVDRLNEQICHRAVAFVDAAVERAHPSMQGRLRGYFQAHKARLELAAPLRVVPGGEPVKNNVSLLGAMVQQLVNERLCRKSFVIAIGGGAVLDAVGFATSLVHRGLRLVRVPTTVLAQNDAGVGVKNAMNFNGAKNMIGTFAPPFAVINDFDFLATLPDQAWRDGIAEAFKVAIIKDAAFFRWLRDHAAQLASRDQALMEQLIMRCADLHLQHIRESGDPFEMGRARPLDFGHWAAHKLEALSGYTISHGQAVAIGVALDSHYAFLMGWLAESEMDAIHAGLADAGFLLWNPLLEQRDADGRLAVLRGLNDFREHLGGELCITFPQGIGRKREAGDMDAALIERAVAALKAAAQQAVPRS